MDVPSRDKRPWTTSEVVDAFKEGNWGFAPAQVRFRPAPQRLGFDGGLEVTWRGYKAIYAFDYKASSTPKTLELMVFQLGRRKPPDWLPMVVVPYLSEAAMTGLEERGISALDLCGNGVLVSPKFALYRTGAPNLFKESAPMRNVFRSSNTSSILARCFLIRGHFGSLMELGEFAQGRLPPRNLQTLSKGTVSKVVQVLVEENLVERNAKGLTLVAKEELMGRLEENFRQETRPTLVGKTLLKEGSIWGRLGSCSMMHTLTGLGSAHQYGLISRNQRLQLYVDNLPFAAGLLEVEPTPLFPTLELIEESSPVVYFDSRPWMEETLASPVQVWLELSQGEPRERVASQQLRTRLLEEGLP